VIVYAPYSPYGTWTTSDLVNCLMDFNYRYIAHSAEVCAANFAHSDDYAQWSYYVPLGFCLERINEP